MGIKNSFIFTDKQIEGLKILKNDNYTSVLFDGGSRSGKTFLILIYLFLLAIKYDGVRILICRFRFAHVKANIWLQDFRKLKQFELFKNIIKEDKQNFIIKIKNSEIWLGGLDDKERTEKILGQEYGIVFFNEAVQINQRTRDMVKTRLAQKIEGLQNKIIYDCNPRHPSHYLFKEFYLEKNPKKIALKFIPDDNKENLPADYIENVLDTLTGNEKKRFRFGEWANVEGSVYNNVFEKNIIECQKDFGVYDIIVGGIDFGYYSAVTIWGIKEKKAYCVAESVLINKTTKDIIDALNEMNKTWYLKNRVVIYCDHELDRIQEINNAGFYAKKAHKEVGAGDSTVNSFELFFDKNCMSTFQSMLNLTRQQDSFGNYIESHVKENDHESDASRYALHGLKENEKHGDNYYFNY